MKRITSWLRRKLSRPESPPAIDLPEVLERAKSEDVPNDHYSVELSFDAQVPGQIETHGTGKNVLMPDIYGNQSDTTEADLKIVDTSPDVDVSTGFNPYDTVVLRDKKGSKKR